jgi:hypothetical protein
MKWIGEIRNRNDNGERKQMGKVVTTEKGMLEKRIREREKREVEPYFYARDFCLKVKATVENSKFSLTYGLRENVMIFSPTLCICSELILATLALRLLPRQVEFNGFCFSAANMCWTCIVKTKRQVQPRAWVLKPELFSCLACCHGTKQPGSNFKTSPLRALYEQCLSKDRSHAGQT